VLTIDRLKEVAIKKLNDIAQLKIEGERVANDLMKIALYNEGKISFLKIFFNQ